MLRTRIIYRYLFGEMLSPFFISLGVFTLVLLVAKIMELTDLVVTRGVGLTVVLRLLLYTLPYFFVFTIPMATLLGVLLAFLRLSQDNEITALKAAGVSLTALLPPVGALAVSAWLATSVLAIWGLPWGNHNFENLVYQVATQKADLALRERVFLDTFPGLVLYVGELPGQGAMRDVFIVDERDPRQVNTIVAKRGKLYPAKAGRITIRLYDGTIHAVGEDLKTAQTAHFETYDVALKASGFTGAQQRTTRHEKEMYLSELWAAVDNAPPDSRKRYLAAMELHKKFSVPFACVILGFIGMPLGLGYSSGGRSWGVAVALVIFLGYYLMLSAAWSFGETGAYPVAVGMWTPNVILAALGWYLFRLRLKEAPAPLADFLARLPQLWRRARGAQEV
ncbi:MAG: LPS export ABC transporter permease LptF [Deltaproteobacteria bacterium]|nr:LPS export ABC transporter permease LptF [Deltaproteobacteria bacterium]